MLGSIKAELKGEERTLVCAHWRNFPPKGSHEDPEEGRASKSITGPEYQRIQVWQRICGLQRMDESKCVSCPHVLYVKHKPLGPVTVDVHGVERPIVDIPTREAAPANRSHLSVHIEKGRTPDATKKTP